MKYRKDDYKSYNKKKTCSLDKHKGFPNQLTRHFAGKHLVPVPSMEKVDKTILHSIAYSGYH